MILARKWASTYGSAWVTSEDLMMQGGPMEGSATFQQCIRALLRSNVFPERQKMDGRSWLYRLDPGVVVGLIEWIHNHEEDENE